MQQHIRDTVGIVTQHVAFGGEVACDHSYAQRFDTLDVRHDRRRALARIVAQQAFTHRCSVHQGVVEDRLPGVLIDLLDVL